MFFKKFFQANNSVRPTSIIRNDNFNFNIYIRFNDTLLQLDSVEFSSDLYNFAYDRFRNNMCSTYTMSKNKIWNINQFSFYYKGKPLSRRSIPLYDYNIVNNSIIDYIPHCLVGGSSKILLPTYNVVQQCEQQLLNEFKVQSGDMDLFAYLQKTILPQLINNYGDLCGQKFKDFIQIYVWLQKCETLSDYINITSLAYRLLMDAHLSDVLVDYISKQFTNNVQSSGEDLLSELRAIFDGVTSLNNTPLFKKLYSLYGFLLTQGFLSFMGITLNDEDYSKYEQRAMLSAYSSKKSFVLCIVDTALFIVERVYDWQRSGDINVFLQSPSKYGDWLKECDRILNLANFSSNLTPHNTDYFSFVADLKNCIEKGEAYGKYFQRDDPESKLVIGRKLNALKLLLNTEITRAAAQQERKQPFGVLVYGASSVAKSSFTKILFNYYAALFDLNNDDSYRYVRNPMDEYWSNFDSSKWCIQLDDIAFLLPNKTSEVDATLKDMLNVINNVPYVPPQASLEDKGKTPVMAKLVIATSNSYDLNAHEYFWCPLAVRRRLPFVVQIEPKDCYKHSNQIFIDPSKLPSESTTEFSDFWTISVYKLKPVQLGSRDSASLELVEKFEDINLFLQKFGVACLTHEKYQEQAMRVGKEHKNVEVCKVCCLPQPHDTCVQVQSKTRNIIDIFIDFCIYICSILFQWDLFLKYIKTLMYFRFCRRYIVRCVSCIKDSTQQIRSLDILYRQTSKRQKLCIGILTTISCSLAMYYYTQSKKDKKANDKNVVQGQVVDKVYTQFEREERNNVWYNNDIALTKFDVPLASQSLVGKTDGEIRDIIGKNCVYLKIKKHGELMYRIIRGTFYKEHYCVTNAHAFKDTDSMYDITIIRSDVNSALNGNITITMSAQSVKFDNTMDLCVFEVRALPPHKDISKFWNNHKDGCSGLGFYLSRSEVGNVEIKNVYDLNYQYDVYVAELDKTHDILIGTAPEETVVGDCGSLLLVNSPRGPMITGLHILGNKNKCGAMVCLKDNIEILISRFEFKIGIQAGASCELSCKDKQNLLMDVHHKSLIRYLDNGKLNVYGSLSGFRPKPKSTVCKTPLFDKMLEYFQVEDNYSKPVMDGWEPWRKNVVEMIQPHVQHDDAILENVKKSFINDIINGLPLDWQTQLCVLDNEAAVNGIPGVMYIDRINCSSSMGFPWNCTKKKYLEPHITEIYPDGVKFDDEVYDRMNNIMHKYVNGERHYPVFMGHLKDEATHIDKIKLKKTRLFTGAPIDWSLVVRKYYLSFVRLLQKNKYIFEAGPGTCCQSKEWSEIYNYLTAFGKDRIVAGDYSKFDKHMNANFILAAFDIIIDLHKRSGFSEEQIRIMYGVAVDTAYPMCNINGDLMEFYGTNPSGHPLTVVINSLVNSLYMRYSYYLLNPKKECITFKNNVHLFTYGDDNIMGVSRNIDWFNHTALVGALNQIGVGYTMADKGAESIPFINIHDASFLKRKWSFDKDTNLYLCPLDEESIIKSLTKWVPSKTIDCYEQMIAVIISANNEYFFYGREIFEARHNFFREILETFPYKVYMERKILPNYEMLQERFLSS